jgi:hypothetical protein
MQRPYDDGSLGRVGLEHHLPPGMRQHKQQHVRRAMYAKVADGHVERNWFVGSARGSLTSAAMTVEPTASP